MMRWLQVVLLGVYGLSTARGKMIVDPADAKETDALLPPSSDSMKRYDAKPSGVINSKLIQNCKFRMFQFLLANLEFHSDANFKIANYVDQKFVPKFKIRELLKNSSQFKFVFVLMIKLKRKEECQER